ncbi:XRE family transcriptional regulator [Streptomyces sp. NBC_00347]|uniref:XRE family transcriptional regulator n=1 Tax=Streptomyces sp. NBC_00347 TaxID=2975721 RepID=UPI00224D4EA5|nr:XRE family transcriptional regulator [Streptomyces sp. NBC_00347]MCX5128280.1 XRE family transcriptional regulator [Streptomyces sp. NBC_00347]
MSQSPGNPAFRAARLERGWHSQSDVATAYAAHAAALGEDAGVDVRQVRRWESSKPGWPNRQARRILQSMFALSLEELGFTPPRSVRDNATTRPEEDGVHRRLLLRGVLGAAPALTLGGGPDRLAAAVANARRFGDHSLASGLRTALDDIARADSSTGPRQVLPAAMELLAVIDTLARDATTPVRRELLGVGARAAEFTAWLHRDAGSPAHLTVFFHDRAAEWATLTGDGPMHAYVLLRKAQATDRHDPARMLDLAQAAARGPWTLPPRARAEALQQEARALALTGAPADTVNRTLDEAHHALDQAGSPEPASCTGPLCAGYTLDRLMAQSAISHREAGQPAQAVDLLQQHLAHGVFAPRDRAFFTAHLSGALAAAGEPDQAAATGLTALRLAATPGFGQALGELRRTAAQLRPHARRPAVRELREALTTLTA